MLFNFMISHNLFSSREGCLFGEWRSSVELGQRASCLESSAKKKCSQLQETLSSSIHLIPALAPVVSRGRRGGRGGRARLREKERERGRDREREKTPVCPPACQSCLTWPLGRFIFHRVFFFSFPLHFSPRHTTLHPLQLHSGHPPFLLCPYPTLTLSSRHPLLHSPPFPIPFIHKCAFSRLRLPSLWPWSPSPRPPPFPTPPLSLKRVCFPLCQPRLPSISCKCVSLFPSIPNCMMTVGARVSSPRPTKRKKRVWTG